MRDITLIHCVMSQHDGTVLMCVLKMVLSHHDVTVIASTVSAFTWYIK